MKKMITLTGFLVSFITMYCQTPDLPGVEKYKTQISFENHRKGRKKIKRKDTNVVSIGFFQSFSDTVEVYANNVMLMHKYVYHDSDLVSTDYTGIDFTAGYRDDIKNVITIVYRNKGRYIQFYLDKRYPYYTIHAYRDDCSICGRKYVMKIM
jgi:hypothetical protein